jgi:hypothetical protein
MNKIPVIKNGNITISDPGLPENDLKKILAATKAMINNIPPATSHFQAIIRIPVKIRTGMLCIRNPRSFLPVDSLPSNTSNENIIIKSIDRIVKILGIQYKIFNLISSQFY